MSKKLNKKIIASIIMIIFSKNVLAENSVIGGETIVSNDEHYYERLASFGGQNGVIVSGESNLGFWSGQGGTSTLYFEAGKYDFIRENAAEPMIISEGKFIDNNTKVGLMFSQFKLPFRESETINILENHTGIWVTPAKMDLLNGPQSTAYASNYIAVEGYNRTILRNDSEIIVIGQDIDTPREFVLLNNLSEVKNTGTIDATFGSAKSTAIKNTPSITNSGSIISTYIAIDSSETTDGEITNNKGVIKQVGVTGKGAILGNNDLTIINSGLIQGSGEYAINGAYDIVNKKGGEVIGKVINIDSLQNQGEVLGTLENVRSIKNHGIITGGLTNVENFTNEETGVFNPVGTIEVSNNSFHNYGIFNVGGANTVGTTDFYGSYKQYSTGKTIFDVNTTQAQNDLLHIHANDVSNGTMLQGGTFGIHRIDSNKLPSLGNKITLVNAEGGFLDSANGVSATPINVVDVSPFVNWKLSQEGNLLKASASLNTAAATGLALSNNQQNFVNYVANGYNAGDLGLINAASKLVSDSTTANLRSAVDSMSGANTQTQNQAIIMTSNQMLGNALSCPTFNQSGTAYNEAECVWGKYNGTQMKQASSDNTPGYKTNDNSYSIGGQVKITSDSFVGGAIRFGQTNSSSNNFGASANVGDVSIGYKKLIGDYYFGASGAFGVSSQSNNRYSTDVLSGQTQNMTSHANTYYGGIRLRNAYQFDTAYNTYIRPYLDLDGVWTSTGSYQENGAMTGIPLQYQSQSNFNFIASPMVEIGGRINIDDITDTSKETTKGMWLKPYVSAGMMFLTNNNSNVQAQVMGANSGSFAINTQGPDSLFKGNVGVQLFSGEKVDVKLEYNGLAGQGFVAQGGSAKLDYRF